MKVYGRNMQLHALFLGQFLSVIDHFFWMKPLYQLKKHMLVLDGAYFVLPMHYLSVEEKSKVYGTLFESPGLQTNAHF